MYEVSRAMLPPQSAQRVAFDTHYELLYSGGADGSLHGLELSHMGLRFRVQAAPAACERGVLGLACNAAGVWSCSEAGVRLHSRCHRRAPSPRTSLTRGHGSRAN